LIFTQLFSRCLLLNERLNEAYMDGENANI